MRHSRKKSIQSKKTANNAAEQIDIDYDDPIKPDDQLILSPEVRISNFTYAYHE